MIHDCLNFLSESWQNRPVVVVLSLVAFAVLVYVLVDTHRHRRKYRKQHPDKYQYEQRSDQKHTEQK